MKKIIFVSLIVLLSLIFKTGFAEQKTDQGWDFFGKWYEWKIKTQLPSQQREIADYFEKSNNIQKKVEKIYKSNKEKIYSELYPNPGKAIRLIDICIKEWKTLKVPELCKKYHAAGLRDLEIKKEYQEARKKYKGWDEELGKISIKSLRYDSTMFSEFFRVLNEAGFMDNMEEECVNLGLMNKEEIQKEYGFFKEYKKGEPVVCPICGQEMKRVRILYEDDKEYDDAIKNKQDKFLFGTKKFEGCPIFGYKCDKCPKWYEEYPGQGANTILIRNWCWGWHELIYKKKK